MAEITLGDYAGYLFLELVKAREMADEYSRQVGERYRQDEILRYFSVPRFKSPKITLTVPVLVSGARFTQTVRFRMSLEDFVATMLQRAESLKTALELTRDGFVRRGGGMARLSRPGVVDGIARDFHKQLVDNVEPLRPDAIVSAQWGRVFRAVLGESRLVKAFEESQSVQELLSSSTAQVLELVRSATVVDRTSIENLLVNPETNTVKNGSSDATVFVITAEMLEEGFYLHSVQEEPGGPSHTIVEFD